MNPVTLILVPGLLGGLIIAVLLVRTQRRSPADHETPRAADERVSSDVINIARIPVAGVGGLGLVAMALAVAWTVPKIGQTLAVGFVLGVLFAVVLTLRRRRNGPMPSSGRHPGANTTLSIDDPLRARDDEDDELAGRGPARLATVPVSRSV